MNMPRNVFAWLACCFLCFVLTKTHAEVLPVGDGTRSTATLTFLWKSDAAKATLIMIPGGEGHIGLTPKKADLGGFYGKTLKPLSNPDITSGLFNVVIFDSPTPLSSSGYYPSSRATSDHLERIERVIQFYKEKFNKPVWLMGHSNGAVSITESYKYLQKKQAEKIVSGLIYSSGRNGASFNSATNVPILFLAHEKDACPKSTNANSRDVFKELGKSNQQPMEYVILKSGEAEPQDPCHSGYHMFFNAHEEAYKAIDRFASGILQ